MIEESPFELRIRNTHIFIYSYYDSLFSFNLSPYTLCNIQAILFFEDKIVRFPELPIQNDKYSQLIIDRAIFFSHFCEDAVIVLKFHWKII